MIMAGQMLNWIYFNIETDVKIVTAVHVFTFTGVIRIMKALSPTPK